MGVGNVLVTIMFAHYMSMSMRDQQENKNQWFFFLSIPLSYPFLF